jgi:hypothetical protein
MPAPTISGNRRISNIIQSTKTEISRRPELSYGNNRRNGRNNNS